MYNNHTPSVSREYRVSEVGANTHIAPHFRAREIQCNDGTDRFLVHPAILVTLERIREYFGKPVLVNSFYRTPDWNRQIGGADGSKHLNGCAADIRINGIPPEEIYSFASDGLNVGGCGIYNTFVHVDVEGRNRRWDNRNE